VQVAAGIDPATSGSAAGVDFTHSDNPEGNGVAMSLSDSPSLCLASEFAVSTWRIPTSAPVVPHESNDVAFWLLVP
jgi:hypothetical protein